MLAAAVTTPASDYARVERAIRFIQANVERQPSLAEVAAEIGLSEFHAQRLFQTWAGVSPKRFLQAVTLAHAKALLAESRPVLETSLAVGLSSASRLHDLFVAVERMTPGEFAAQARGLSLRWSVHETPLGPALFASLPRGLCALTFVDESEQGALEELRLRWPGATFEHAPAANREHVEVLEARLSGSPRPLGLVLKGTPLQLKVWEALLRIPEGRVTTYGDLARWLGSPGASRAVGSAVGANPVGVLIPCHRVIASTGAIAGYRWGLARKAALLGRERVRTSPAEAP